MLHQILVPLDGSALAYRAVPTALALARRTDAALHLVSVHRPMVPTMGAVGIAPEVIAAYENLDRLSRAELADSLERTRLEAAAGGVTVHGTVLEGAGSVCDQLVAYGSAHDIDLVVMTTHGRGAMGRFLMGSVADGLLRMAGRPCLLLRAETTGDAAPSAPATARAERERQAQFRRVLVPLDGTLEAERAIDAALEIAPADAVELLLVQVVVPLLWFVPTLPAGGVDLSGGAVAARERLADQYLESVGARLRLRGVRARTLTVIHYSPAATILDLLERERMDLLAMSARQGGGAVRVLLGSVMDKVVRRSPVPVLVARVAVASPSAADEVLVAPMAVSGAVDGLAGVHR